MDYELTCTHPSNGKVVRARVTAATLEEAMLKARNHGLTVVGVHDPMAQPGAAPVTAAGSGRDRAEEGGEGGQSWSRWSKLAAIASVTALGMGAGVWSLVRLADSVGPASRGVVPQVELVGNASAPSGAASDAAAALPPHVVRGSGGTPEPEPGYRWRSIGSLEVEWAAGLAHPQYQNVASSEREGEWRAAEGYVFPNTGDLTVAWQPGRRHTRIEHVAAAQREGYWQADPGYTFPEKGSLEVRWTPGSLDPLNAHVVAGDVPGKWRPAPGYDWERPQDAASMAVVWRRGLPHATAAHLISGVSEGVWEPAAGYRWANSVPGDLSVVRRSGPSEQQVQAGLAKIVVAVVAGSAAQGQADDSLIESFGRELARTVRDEAVKSAFADLFPNEHRRATDAAAVIVCLIADGELSIGNIVTETARDVVIDLIRERDPNVGDAAALADFVVRAVAAHRSRG